MFAAHGTNQNGYLSSSVAFDPYWSNVTLLLNAETSTNSSVLDSSSAGNVITTSATYPVSTTIAKFGSQSLFFNGTSNLSMSYNTSFNLGSTYTLEAWVNPTVYGASGSEILTIANSNVTNFGALIFEITSTGALQLQVRPSTGGANVTVSGGTVSLNVWSHVAASVIGGAVTLFVNGVSVATGTVSALDNTQTFVSVGSINNGVTPTKNFSGYIDDLRVTKGINRYSVSFTPSTQAYYGVMSAVDPTVDPYWAQTMLSLNGDGVVGGQNSSIVDSSSVGATPTIVGAPVQGTISPFGNAGGSAYFDGSSYFYFPSNALYGFGTSGDFTVETWFKADANGLSKAMVLDLRANGSLLGMAIYIDTSILYVNQTNSSVLWAGPTIVANTWYHVAATRSGGLGYIFLNGVQQIGGFAFPTNFPATPLYIGTNSLATGTYNFRGYISSTRIAASAAYTASFKLPSAPFTASSLTNTRALLNFDRGNIVDGSRHSNVTLYGNTSVSSVSATGGGSIYFDGTGDYVSVPYTTVGTNIGSVGDFTLDCWVCPTGATATNTTGLSAIFAQTSVSSTTNTLLGVFNKKFVFQYSNSGANTLTSTTTISSGVWYHVAVTRSGTSMTLWINGVSESTTTATTGAGLSIGYTMGNYWNGSTIGGGGGSLDFSGYVDDLRYTPGVVRYTSAFSTANLKYVRPPLSKAVELYLDADGSTVVDRSKNSFAITNTNVTQSTDASTRGAGTGTNALVFNGSSYLVTATSSALLPASSIDWTVDGWFNVTITGAYAVLWCAGNGASTLIYQYLTSAGKIYNEIYTGSGYGGSGSGPTLASMSSGVWTHLAWVYDAAAKTLKIYVNGVLGDTVSMTAYYTVPFTAPRMVFGRSDPGVSTVSPLTGKIDNFRFTRGIQRWKSNFSPD